MNKVGIIYDDRFNLHRPMVEHPENPERLQSIIRYLKRTSFIQDSDLLTPPEATAEQILAVHTQEHVEKIEKAISESKGALDADTYINKNSYLSARLAAGSVIFAVDLVSEGKFKYVFCPVRPPGHHAESNKAMGFCLFNNVAIGARYAIQHKGMKKIAVVDFDVHHGNGTQEIFYNSSDVLVINLHQHPLYPGTGTRNERGIGAGEGFTINYPLPSGTGGEKYIQITKDVIEGPLHKYNPDILFISAGFDAHQDDPLAQMNLTEEDFSEITRLLKEFADKLNIPVISVLEGGYNLDALPASVYAHLSILNS